MKMDFLTYMQMSVAWTMKDKGLIKYLNRQWFEYVKLQQKYK